MGIAAARSLTVSGRLQTRMLLNGWAADDARLANEGRYHARDISNPEGTIAAQSF